MTKHGEDIRKASLRNEIRPGIRTPLRFRGLQAAVWAGATLDELQKWEMGRYSPRFKAKIIALYNLEHLIKAHVEDEKAKEIDRKSK